MTDPTFEELRALLSYDPESGALTWRTNRNSKVQAGNEAGSLDGHGYLQIRISGRLYLSHRLAWAITHGTWPAGDIDHLDGNKLNNAIGNLRDVSKSVNMQNRKRAQGNNRSGSLVPGVSWHKGAGKFVVQANRDGRRTHVGYFSGLAEAEAASLAHRRANYPGNLL